MWINEFFYFDKKLCTYENLFQWDRALIYLESLYSKNKDITLLNSLIGYSWYYLIEGPVVSQEYENDKSVMALAVWKKYIDLGAQEARNNPFFNFIAGYTLSLHGFYINEEYERKGHVFMKNCLDMSNNLMLKNLSENFLKNERSPKYIPLKDGRAICTQLFKGESLLDRYFNKIYTD